MKLLLFILLSSSMTLAECNPEDDGDCCTKDSDCRAYVHSALCSIIPLNQRAAERLESDRSLSEKSVCDSSRLADLLQEARTMRVRCVDSACELSEE